MANPTTNFGWVMPTSTSLVTNLPADFNTFGQGVDTSLQYLLGGTTGQVLSKTSGTNMAFTWVTPTDQTPLTTKGDLFAFTTVDARLAVGADGTALVADSAQATGLAYKTPGVLNGLTTTGDTLYSSSGTTQARLGIGSTGQVLTVAGGVPSWATPSSGGMTLISTTTLSGSSITLSSIPSTYNELQLWIVNFDPSASARFRIAPNAGTTASDNVVLEAAGGGSATTQAYQGYMRTYNTFNATTATNTIIAVFPAYTSTAGRKSAYMTAGFLDGGGGNRTEAIFNKLECGAMTSLVLSPDTGTFDGGTAYLYGVK